MTGKNLDGNLGESSRGAHGSACGGFIVGARERLLVLARRLSPVRKEKGRVPTKTTRC